MLASHCSQLTMHKLKHVTTDWVMVRTQIDNLLPGQLYKSIGISCCEMNGELEPWAMSMVSTCCLRDTGIQYSPFSGSHRKLDGYIFAIPWGQVKVWSCVERGWSLESRSHIQDLLQSSVSFRWQTRIWSFPVCHCSGQSSLSLDLYRPEFPTWT